jgi:hypothetical protein
VKNQRAFVVSLIRGFAVCMLFAIILATSTSAQTTTYTYTGNAYSFDGIANLSICPLTGSFTIANPLPPNSIGLVVSVISFSFTDCANTMNITN